MKLTKPLVICALLMLSGCHNSNEDVPSELFGLKLGEAYDLGEGTKDNFGSFPVKQLIGAETFLGAGVHVYFEPLKVSESFSYVEKTTKRSTGDYKTTSFHAYLLPVVPKSLKTMSELESFKIKQYSVERIDWSSDKVNRKDAYFWALDLCKTLAAQIKIKTEITNTFDPKGETSFASCKFVQNDRELSIYNLGARAQFELTFKEDVSKARSDELENFIRKIRAQEILK